MPGAYDGIVRLLVPELQRRGLFQKDYSGPTLRDNLGLLIPRAADWHAACRRPMSIGTPCLYRTGRWDREFADSPLEERRFELSVPP
jgi:hypothetical protein